MPLHGFAKDCVWKVERSASGGDGATVVLRLEASDAFPFRSSFPFDFSVSYFARK